MSRMTSQNHSVVLLVLRNHKKEIKMEEVLPRDIVNEILIRLSDKDLFTYGLSSKRCLESAEYIWKKRYEDLEGIESSEQISSNYWYHHYIHKSKNNFVNKMKQDIMIFYSLDRSLDRKLRLEKIYDYILDNISILSRKSLKDLNNTLKDKLLIFIDSHCRYEKNITTKYYPLLFPEEYNQYLMRKYLYESGEDREDPDYV